MNALKHPENEKYDLLRFSSSPGERVGGGLGRFKLLPSFTVIFKASLTCHIQLELGENLTHRCSTLRRSTMSVDLEMSKKLMYLSKDGGAHRAIGGGGLE